MLSAPRPVGRHAHTRPSTQYGLSAGGHTHLMHPATICLFLVHCPLISSLMSPVLFIPPSISPSYETQGPSFAPCARTNPLADVSAWTSMPWIALQMSDSDAAHGRPVLIRVSSPSCFIDSLPRRSASLRPIHSPSDAAFPTCSQFVSVQLTRVV